MNSTEDIGMGSTSSRALDSAFSALALTAQALNASTSSAFETASGGVNRPVEAMTAWRDGCSGGVRLGRLPYHEETTARQALGFRRDRAAGWSKAPDQTKPGGGDQVEPHHGVPIQ